MKINVNEKEYVIEFGMEAALMPEAIQEMARLVVENFVVQTDIKRITSFMATIPKATLKLFYAGLLEHHGESGDRTIRSEKDAKRVLKLYLKANPEVSFIDLLNKLLEQIAEDNFVEKTAVFKFLKGNNTENAAQEEVTA